MRAGSISAVLAAGIILALLLWANQPSRSQAYGEAWWDGGWHYRVKLTVNTTGYERSGWPVEVPVNFTSLLEGMNVTDPFDENSTRVVEVNSSGGILHELPSQFDPDLYSYNESSNAVGTVVFTLNGTTPSQTERWFYVYFDVQVHQKQGPGYQTLINKSWDGEEFKVTYNTDTGSEDYGYFTFDTNRSENTSGLYQHFDGFADEYTFTYSTSGERTRELIQTTDGTYNYTYDLRGNASFSEGPGRIRVHQEGYEVYWDQADNQTGMTYVRKDYYFYPNKSWFVMEHEIANLNGSSPVTRWSYAGAPGFDVLGAYESGYKIESDYSSDPGSMISGTAEFGVYKGGFAHLWENGTSGFRADNYTDGSTPDYDRIGINLTSVDIPAGQSIQDKSVMVFYHNVRSPTLLTDTKDRLITDVNTTLGSPETWVITLDPRTDHAIYNRNESSIIYMNVTRDDWSLVDHVNATLDLGTPGTGDDVTFGLLDDGAYPDEVAGDGNFSAYYNLSDSDATGYWNLTTRAYDPGGSLLNESYHTFNLTSELVVDISIWNETGVYRVENATVNVTNLRQDIPIPGATDINCTAAGDQVTQGNITDNDDGSYIVTFQTPLDYGLYPLNCSFGKDGSWGFRVENFTVEAPNTTLALNATPSTFHSYDVTFSGNESFDLEVTLENIENSTAYSANVSLELPPELSSNSTFEECGQILISLSCASSFNISILNNTQAGDYDLNVSITWGNRVGDPGFNTTNVTVTVHENPLVDVIQDEVKGILPPGASSQAIETLTVRSAGNNDTLNVSLQVSGLDDFSVQFIPQDISLMAPGQESPVEVRASVPGGYSPGVYDGEVNVTSDNGGYVLLNATIVVTGTNLTINATPGQHDAYYVTAYENESFEFSVNVTNTGNTTAFNSFIELSYPGNWFLNQSSHQCGNLSKGESCFADFLVNITELTQAGLYQVNATINWEDIGISWKSSNTSLNVTVVQNVTLEVKETGLSGILEHGTSIMVGYINLASTGNDDALSVDFNLSQELENFTMGYNQTHPFTMTPGDARTVRINATIPLGFGPGDYNGTLNVTSSNDGHKALSLNLTVPQNGSWTMNTTFCEHSQSPSTGKVCDVLINNTGNILLNFTVTPQGANHSNVSMTLFNLTKQDSTILEVTYDMGTEAGDAFFFANYTIDPQEAAASPDNRTLEILLNPYVQPLIEIGVTPNLTQQGDQVEIVVNITSQSGALFDVTELTVERPDGTNDTMTLGFSEQVFWLGCSLYIEDPDDMLCFRVTYPGDLPGNTSLRGNYTIYGFANDTYAVNSTNSSVFKAYARYMPYIRMPDTGQGAWESVAYRAQDYMGAALPGSYVNITIRDPDSRSVYMLSGNEYVTDESGWVSDNIFVIPASATLGEYTVHTNGTYYEPSVGLWVSNETSVTFNVSKQNLIGKVAVPSPLYVDNMMTLSVIVLENFNEPIDPEEVNLTLYYTEGYTLSPFRSLDLSDLSRESEGFYRYSEVLSSVLTGSYLALLKVKVGSRETYDIQPFRIASGGPYDVFLDLVQSEAAPGSFLDFDITIWNKGEIDHQDVVTDYWVYGSGQSWDSSSFSTNILGGENKTFRRNAFIYSNQPPGFYTLNAEVLYDPNQPPATANATFLVTGEAPPEEPPGGGGEGGGGEGAPSAPGAGPSPGQINITSIPDQLGVMVGEPRVFNLKVEATGGLVSDVWLEFQGIPEDWIGDIQPGNISSLGADQSRTFTVQITVPRGESGDRLVRVVAHSTGSTDEAPFTLRIFTSRKDLINFELARLRAKLEELRDRAEDARQSGFDTTEVDGLLDDAEQEIKLAEGYLREELYEPALESVYTAWRHLDEAEDLLDSMLAGFTLPWWVFLVVIFAAITAGLFFLYRRIRENLRVLVRGRMSEARAVAGTVKGAGTEVGKLREEKAKTERMLQLLSTQHQQGIISAEAYNSLKSRSEQRIAELDKQIREALKG